MMNYIVSDWADMILMLKLAIRNCVYSPPRW